MATTQVLMKVGILIVSFLIGMLFYYFTNPANKETKKHQLESVASQLINFVIYIWMGKVIIQFKLFIQDPVAVLAYPSNAEAFYIATILFIVTIGFQVFRKKINLSKFMETFVPVFLASSFIYEFIQLTFNEANTIIYLVLLTGLLMIYMATAKQQTRFIHILLLGGWALGQLIITFVMPYATAFSYLLSPYFFVGVTIISISMYVYNYRKKVF